MLSKQKSFLFSCVAFLISISLFFAVGEIMFRIFRGSPNPLIDVTQHGKKYLFEPGKPIHSKSSVEGEFDYIEQINSHGYRGAEFVCPKADNVLRVMVVGDSFTHGVGAEDHQTISYLLEQGLKKKYPQVEVINAGVGHTGPLRHYVNLRDIHLSHDPDIVLLLMDLTDVHDDWYAERIAVVDKQGEVRDFNPTIINGKRSWWLTAVNKSAFCRWIHDKIVRSFRKVMQLGPKRYAEISKNKGRAKAAIANDPTITDEQTIMEYDQLFIMRGDLRKDLIDKNFERSAKYLTKIHDLLASKNIPLILGVYPHGLYVGGDQWVEGRKTWGFAEGMVNTNYYPFEIVENYSKSEGIPFINALNGFLAAPKGMKYFHDWDGHMTPAGYAVVADAILESPALYETLDNVLARRRNMR